LNPTFYLTQLRKAQRKALLWVISGYDSISYEEAWLSSGEVPIESRVNELSERYWIKKKGGTPLLIRHQLTEIRVKTRDKDKETLARMHSNGLIGHILFADEAARSACINNITTQYLTGHGRFRGYLFNRERAEDPLCPHCMDRVCETPYHILFYCDGYNAIREKFDSIIEKCELTEGKATWDLEDAQAFVDLCRACEKGRWKE